MLRVSMSEYAHCQIIPYTRLTLKDLNALNAERCWSLGQVEQRAIQSYFKKLKREPTDVELETLAQTWSEHCKHKTLTSPVTFKERDADGRTRIHKFGNLLKETIFAATKTLEPQHTLSVFEDNAGVMALGSGRWALAFKVETHNHPSALEPYGGAATGLGGVIRDILGVGRGARPIANTNVFCVGPLGHEGQIPKGLMHPRRTLRQVTAGVRDYGNRMGIPTVAGGLHFDDGFVHNPLVFCGTVGVMPRTAVQKSVSAGDLIVVLGGRTGRDGIHGATFSSGVLDDSASTSAVQVGNPIEEKKLMDVLLVARDQKLFRSVTDCGAGGLSSGVGEMGALLGAEIHADRVPLKHQGMAPWEIWLSESQERMVLAVPPKNWPALQALCAAEDVEVTEIGTYKDSGRLQVFFEGERVADLTMSFLHDGLPRVMQRAEWSAPRPPPGRSRSRGDDAEVDWPTAGAQLRTLLADPNTCSRAWLIRQYDHEVLGQTVGKPFHGVGAGPADAAVIWPMVVTQDKSVPPVAIAMGLSVGVVDPYKGAVAAVDEALRNLICVGADISKGGLLDNFCWGDPRDPQQLGSLTRSAMGCHDAAVAYGVPFISGKDSLNNAYVDEKGQRHSIPGTLLISAVAPLPSVEAKITMDVKNPDHRLWIVGPKKPGLQASRAVMDGVRQAISSNMVVSAHDCSEGGVAVAAAEMALAGDLGLDITWDEAEMTTHEPDFFTEALTRFVVEVDPAKEKKFAALFKEQLCRPFATVSKEKVFRVRTGRGVALEEPLSALRAAWTQTLPRLLDGSPAPAPTRGSHSAAAEASP